jgi:amino acid transporter
MWTAVFWSWVFGLVAVAAYVLTMPSLEEAHAAGWGSFFYMWGSSRMPGWLSIVLAFGMVLVNYVCALAGLTSTSRMMYAFARDGGLPASSSLSQVSTVYRTPGTAVWVSAILAFVSTLYAPAYLVLAVACAVFLYLSMVMPVAAGFLREGTAKWPEKGPFNLGGLSKPNAILAVIFGVILAISGFFPPNEKVFYFTIVFVVALLAAWSKRTAIISIVVAVLGFLAGFLPVSDENVLHFLIPDSTTAYIAIGVAVVLSIITFMTGGEENRFEGVPEGEKIAQRQKMIADIEKKYGEA